MFQRASGVTVAVAVLWLSVFCTNPARGAFVGVDFVFDAARSASANAGTGSQALVGGPVDIYLMYAGYDLATDRFLNIFNVNMDAGTALINQAGGGDLAPNDALFAFSPAQWDTFVTIGGLSQAAAPAGTVASGGGVGFTSTGISNGDWFTTPPTGLGVPVFNAALGFYTVVLGQFAVSQGVRAVFTGDYETTFSSNAALGTFNGSFGFFPTPGSAVLIGLAGLVLARRKRE